MIRVKDQWSARPPSHFLDMLHSR